MSSSDRYSAAIRRAKDNLEYWVEGAILDFTEEIVSLMEERDVSRAELARRMEASPAYVTKVLAGDTNFTMASMVKIARALDAEVRIQLPLVSDSSEEWSGGFVYEGAPRPISKTPDHYENTDEFSIAA